MSQIRKLTRAQKCMLFNVVQRGKLLPVDGTPDKDNLLELLRQGYATTYKDQGRAMYTATHTGRELVSRPPKPRFLKKVKKK